MRKWDRSCKLFHRPGRVYHHTPFRMVLYVLSQEPRSYPEEERSLSGHSQDQGCCYRKVLYRKAVPMVLLKVAEDTGQLPDEGFHHNGVFLNVQGSLA